MGVDEFIEKSFLFVLRNCIGQNFAMNEMKVVIGQILRKFELFCDEDCPEPHMKPNFILESENGIHVKFKPL